MISVVSVVSIVCDMRADDSRWNHYIQSRSCIGKCLIKEVVILPHGLFEEAYTLSFWDDPLEIRRTWTSVAKSHQNNNKNTHLSVVLATVSCQPSLATSRMAIQGIMRPNTTPGRSLWMWPSSGRDVLSMLWLVYVRLATVHRVGRVLVVGGQGQKA